MDSQIKSRYILQEIAGRLRIPASHLRYLEKQFKEIQPFKGDDNVFYYKFRDIVFFRTIYHLIYNKNYTISEVKKILNHYDFDIILAIPDNETLLEELTKKRQQAPFEPIRHKSITQAPAGNANAGTDLLQDQALGDVPVYNPKLQQELLTAAMREVMKCKRLLEEAKNS